MAIPSSIIPSTATEVLAEQDALKASSSFRRLPQKDLPSFIVSLTSKIANEPVDTKKLYSSNTAIRQSYYSHLLKTSKLEASLLVLAIKYDKLDKLNTQSIRIDYLNRLAHLVMIFMGKYSVVLNDVPKTDIISNKLGKDVYFHLIKRLPSLVSLVSSPDPVESSKAFSDALYYIKSSILHPLTRFISLLLGELASSGNKPDIDKREFKRELKRDKANLKEDFRKNKKFYKSKWLALRNEASATLSNLEIEASVASNSSKTRDILNERRARIDNFVYSLEQGIQAINNGSFEGFVSAKISIEDSIIEYSKRLEFRTIARRSKEIDEAFKLKNKVPGRRQAQPASTWNMPSIRGSRSRSRATKGGLDGAVHSVLKHLGPAGLSLYAGYKLVNNPITRLLIGKPLKYLGSKALQGTGFVAKAAGRKFLQSMGELSQLALSLAGRGLPAAGTMVMRGLGLARTKAIGLGTRLAPKLRASYSKTKSSAGSLVNRAMYGAGYGLGSSVRIAREGSGLLSKLVRNTFSPTSLSSLARIDPEMSGLEPIIPSPIQQSPPSKFPLDLLDRASATDIAQPQSPKFPLELISRRNEALPKLKSGLSSPVADLFIDDILDRIDEHIPYIPADLTEQDFALEDIKDAVGDALEEFLSGSSPYKNKLSEIIAQESTGSLASIPSTITSTAEENLENPPKALTELKSEQADLIKSHAVYESKISDLVKTNLSLQEQLESLDKQLDKLLAQQVRRNPYDSGLLSEVSRVKDNLVEKITHVESLVVKSTRELVYDRFKGKNIVEGKTDDQLLFEETTARADRADRTKLIEAVQKLSRSKSRSSQAGGISVSGMLSSLIGSSLVGKALSSIESVLGGKTGGLIKSVLPSIIKYAPRLASFALPAIALAGSAYAGWELGTSLYEKYSTEILDAIDSVINTATHIVQGIKEGYEFLTSVMKAPAEKLKEAGARLSRWWDTNPISRGADYVAKGSARAATIISDKASHVGSAVVSGAQDVGSAVSSRVDSIITTASGAKNYISDRVGKLFTLNRSTVDFDNLDPTVKSSFETMAEEYRLMGGTKPLNIESARRSTEQQAKLHAANPKLAAKPGHSLHEQGRALDIDRATAGELESMGLLSKYGFSRNVKDEPWHLSYTGNTKPLSPNSIATPVTKTQVQTTPTTTKPNYEQPPVSSPVQNRTTVNTPTQKPSGKSAIETFSFIDSSFFVMNAGMMAS